MRKQLLRKVLALTLTVSVGILPLAGCGNSGEGSGTSGETQGTAENAAAENAVVENGAAEGESSEPQGEETQVQAGGGETIEITWMHKFVEPGILKWVDEVIANFETANPDIKVHTETVPADDYEQMLKTKIASDDAPDVFVLDNQSRYQEFSAAERLYDLSSLEGIENINPDMLYDGQVNGVQYAVPLDVNAYAVHYNKDLFEQYDLEVPTTISEMRNVCEVLQENGIKPFGAGYATQFCVQFSVEVLLLPLCMDGEWHTNKIERKSSFAEDEKFKEAMKLWDSFYEFTGDDPWGTDWDTVQNQMANGEAAMIVNGSWTVDGVSSINPDINIGIFAMPTFEEKDSSVILMKPGAGICLYNNTQDEARLEAARKFFNYLLSEESGNSYARNAFKISTLKNADCSFSPALMDALSYPAERTWNSAGLTLFNSEYETVFYDTITKYAMQDTLDIDALCAELDQNFAAISK